MSLLEIVKYSVGCVKIYILTLDLNQLTDHAVNSESKQPKLVQYYTFFRFDLLAIGMRIFHSFKKVQFTYFCHLCPCTRFLKTPER